MAQDLDQLKQTFSKIKTTDGKPSPIAKEIDDLQQAAAFAESSGIPAAASTVQTLQQNLVNDIAAAIPKLKSDVTRRVPDAGAKLDELETVIKKVAPTKDIAEMSDDELKRNFTAVVNNDLKADHPKLSLPAAGASQSAPAAGKPAQAQGTGHNLDDLEKIAAQLNPRVAEAIEDIKGIATAEVDITSQAGKQKMLDALEKTRVDILHKAGMDANGQVRADAAHNDFTDPVTHTQAQRESFVNPATGAENTAVTQRYQGHFVKEAAALKQAEDAVKNGAPDARKKIDFALDQIATQGMIPVEILAGVEKMQVTNAAGAEQALRDMAGAGGDKAVKEAQNTADHHPLALDLAGMVNEALKNTKTQIGVPIAQNEPPSAPPTYKAGVQQATGGRGTPS